MAFHHESKRQAATTEPPKVSRWLQKGFHRFLESYLRKHFDGVGISAASLLHLESTLSFSCDKTTNDNNIAEAPPVPLIVYANHPSWWDPMIAQFLNRNLLPGYQFYAPIDADALEHYRVLKQLGFYGVQQGTIEGVKNFLRQSEAIANQGKTAIWITPEGRFTDARDHSADWMPGLAHLCQNLRSGFAIPVALEYTFWNESRPVCLASIGEVHPIEELKHLNKAQCGQKLSESLRGAQDHLRDLAVARNPEAFEFLISGKTGPQGLYGRVRKIASLLRGNRIKPRHGAPLR